MSWVGLLVQGPDSWGELAKADPHWLGLAVHTVAGDAAAIGDAEQPFTLQSISKVFGLAALLECEGEGVFERVSCEPSGDAFHSIVRLEEESGRPRNPYINAGAICVTSRLPGETARAKVEMPGGSPGCRSSSPIGAWIR